MTNCFKDGSSKHYGIKYKKYWFFVSHTNNEYSLKIPSNELNTYGEKYGDSFIVSYATCNPNILKKDCVRIHSRILDEYIDKFLK